MKLIIFGDSHTRSFMNVKNIYPFFLGPGQRFNLNNNKYNNIINSINTFFRKYKDQISNNDLYFLYFGEPNCRFLVDNNYYPFLKDIKLWKNYKKNEKKLKEINIFINNYDKIINTIKKYTKNYFIITPTTGFYPSLIYLNYFNNILKEKYKMKIINIYSELVNENGLVDSYYLNKDYKKDPIHLNNNICLLFLNTLKKKNLINTTKIYTSDYEQNTNFIKHDRFNTYII